MLAPEIFRMDYAKLPTEQSNPRTRHIHRLSVIKILDLISREDQSVPLAVAKVKPAIARAVSVIVKSLGSGGRLFFAGAGTSGRLGVLEAAECPPTFNTPPSLINAVMAGGRGSVFRSKEGAEDRREEALRIFQKKLRAGDVLVGIAASGVTPFVAGALEAARIKKASRIVVACNNASPFRKLADIVIAPQPGPEVITGSTRLKAGTATKLVLNMLTAASMIRLGKVYQNWMVDLQPKSRKLRARALGLIKHLGSVPAKDAEVLLKRSHRNVKTAILMARKGLTYSQALTRLSKSRGFLEEALR